MKWRMHRIISGATMNKAESMDVREILNDLDNVESYRIEQIIYMANTMLSFEKEDVSVPSGTVMLQSDKDPALNYFLEDNSILSDIAPERCICLLLLWRRQILPREIP